MSNTSQNINEKTTINEIVNVKVVNDNSDQNIPVAEITAKLPIAEQIISDEYSTVYNTETTSYFEREYNLEKCWRYRKTIKIFAGVDCFFCILIGVFFNYFFFLASILPMTGYYGALNYNIFQSIIYLIYCYTNTFLKVIQINTIIYPSINSTFYNNNINIDNNTNIVIVGLSLFTQLWITIITTKFVCMVNSLNPTELKKLRNKYSPKVTTFIMY